MSGEVLTVAEVAAVLRVGLPFVRKLIKDGELFFEPNRGEVISEAQLEHFIDAHRADTAVYFICMPLAGHVKIGIARNVKHRLDALQTANPEKLEVLAFTVVVDGRGLERQLHRKLAPYRLNGEWFREGEWLDPIRKLSARGGPGLSEGAVRKALLV